MALAGRLLLIGARLDALLEEVRGLEDEELLDALTQRQYILSDLVAQLQPLLHAAQGGGGGDGPLAAAARFVAGYTAYLLGSGESAVACLRLATAWAAAPASWHYLHAQAATDDPAAQERAHRAAIARSPSHLPSYTELMGLLSDRGDMEAFRALAAQASRVRPPMYTLWSDPWQRPDHLLPGLTAQPWHDPATIPWCAKLAAHAATVRAELLAVVASQRIASGSDGWQAVGAHQRADFGGSDRRLVAKGGSWREFVLLGAPQDEEEERRVAENCRRCPQTAALLRSIPAVLGLAEAGLGEALFS
ncbi:MAG: aspartyl/asparaginyl beta-hydroxylase domain-containing protein, partial [Actinomycetota bacterium]|nr:aspartyl/asparaginyl beta-hydroxylase domain-containing protein [Actinomycetota bacterium]